MSDRTNQFSRRTVLQGVSGGVATVGLAGIVSGDDRTTEIVTVKQGDEPVVVKKVSRTWWEHVETARAVRERLQERLANDGDVESVALGLGSGTVGGRPERRVTVKVNDETASPGLPDSIDGVPVGIEEARSINLHTGDYCDIEDEDPVPGGAALTHDSVGDDDPYFTATCPVMKGGFLHVLTTGHAFGSPTWCTTMSDVDVYQGESEEEIGELETVDIDADYALIDHDSDLSLADEVKTSSSETVRISGHVTEDGMEYRKGDTIEKYGAKTCKTAGTLDEVDDGGHCSGDVDWVYVDDLTSEVGDSGSPYFDIWEDTEGCKWASIVAVHIGDVDDDTQDSIGCPAYEIVEREDEDIEFGYTFDSPCGPIQ